MSHYPLLRNDLIVRILLVSALLMAFPCSGWPDGSAKMDASLSRALRVQSDLSRLMKTTPGVTLKGNEAHINVFIEMNGVPPSSLRDHGVQILSRAGNIYIARLPLASLAAVASLPGVARLESDAWVRPVLNLSIPHIRADEVWQDGQYGNLQGEGVIVGMVDSGINLRHKNFIERGSEVSRVLRVWDMGDGTGPPPVSCMDYTVYPPQPIACQGTECRPQEEDCAQVDDLGHGSMVMGAMAGNGEADCPAESQESSCTGVARKGEIIVVKQGLWLASEVIQGVDYVFQKADDLGMPAVVNLSLSWDGGSRDGNSLLERNLSELAGAGRIIVNSAGNDALEMGHARIVSNGDRRTVYFDCMPTTSDVVDVYGWYDAPASGSVQVRVLDFDANSTGWVGFGDPDGVLDAGRGMATVQHNETSGNATGFTVTLESGTNRLQQSLWHIEVRNPGAAALGATVDLWVERTLEVGPSSGNCPKPARFIKDHQERLSTITPPCSANDVICVGSYNTRCTAQSLDFCTGCSLDYSSFGVNNCVDPGDLPEAFEDISSFSSLGPTRDGRERPLLAAPGNAILTPDERGSDGYSYGGGTSFAAPHVAGTVALMLQADPGLEPKDVRDALRFSARTRQGAGRDEAWGAGMLDAYGAVEEVASALPPPPPPTPQGLGEGDDFCFIATAAFGEIDAPQVQRLREMRDRSLLKTSLGRRFVRFYYRWSPPVAAWLKEHAVSSKIVRLSLMPVVGWSEMAYHRSSVQGAALSVVGLFLISAVCCFSYRRRTR